MRLTRPVSLLGAGVLLIGFCFAGAALAAPPVKPATPAAATPAPAPTPAPPPAAGQPPAAQPAAAGEAPAPEAPAPYRTEILSIESWTVTCQEFLLPKQKRLCAASLRVVRQGTQQVIMALNVGSDENGRPIGMLTTPTGVIIAKGVDLGVGGTPRKLAFETCDNAQCTANIGFDEKLSRDLQAATSVDVTLTAINGSSIKVNFGVKGFDKALAAMGMKL